MSPDDLLTIAETATLLRVSTMTVRRWIKAGRLSGHKIGPRTIRLFRSEVEALLTESEPGEVPTVYGAQELPALSEVEMTRLFDALREAGKLRRRMNRARGGKNLSSSADLITEARQKSTNQA